MFEALKHILNGQHQFASDGLLLMIVGGLGVYLRAIPLRIWEWLVGQTTMTITVKDDDAAFVWVKEWFLEQKFLTRIRRVDLDTELARQKAALVPGQGNHYFWHFGRPFRVEFYRSEGKKGFSAQRIESLTFWTVGRNQIFLKKFVADIVACHEMILALTSSLHVRDDSYWTRVQSYTPRLLDSVILPAGEKEHLVQDIEKFRSSKDRYRQLGVPYHRGYLFYGPPGTGKTSLVSALAANFGMSIYAISLTEFNDRSLMRAIHDVPPNSMILFEDIDCMRAGNARPSAEARGNVRLAENPIAAEPSTNLGVTLSGLLNILDGFHAPEAVLFVMTTNKIETLDDALLRPGRIDYRLYLGKAVHTQKIELYTRFFPNASAGEAAAFVDLNRHAETMAEFQGLLLSLQQECAAVQLLEN